MEEPNESFPISGKLDISCFSILNKAKTLNQYKMNRYFKNLWKALIGKRFIQVKGTKINVSNNPQLSEFIMPKGVLSRGDVHIDLSNTGITKIDLT